MIISLIVVVNAALVCPIMTASTGYPPIGDLIDHVEPNAEILYKNEFMPMIRKAISSEIVADALYQARDKASTEVVDGVTVAKLIELNTLNDYTKDCSKESMADRAQIYRKVKAATKPDESLWPLLEFVDALLYTAASSCETFKDEFTDDVEYKKWLTGFIPGVIASDGGEAGPILADYILGFESEAPVSV